MQKDDDGFVTSVNRELRSSSEVSVVSTWARHIASAFDTLQSDLGEGLKAADESTDESRHY
jgi:hypothetical protein